MHTPLRHQMHQEILRVLTHARPLVEAIAHHDRELASQARRALSSVLLNAAEGFGSRGGNARLRFHSARGSLYEARAALECAIVWGYVEAARAEAILAELHALGGRLYGLGRG